MAVSIMITAFLVCDMCSLVDICEHFRRTHCLHFQNNYPEDGGNNMGSNSRKLYLNQ